ncbi:LOW QUALITY PROTEIN: breast cancer anti-estrogen resistance protein 1 [Menidia menidia]
MNYLNILAKALYDNVAESPDELSFRKGDIMTVLERDTQGLDGWWLCSLHGRQGIVPGNRLKILVGMYDSRQGPDQSQRPLPPPTQSAFAKTAPSVAVGNKPPGAMHSAYSAPSPAQAPPPDSVYMMPPSHGPKGGVYQVPSGPGGPHGTSPSPSPQAPTKAPLRGHRQFNLPGQDIYQVPPSLGQDIYQVPPSLGQDIYQVPPSLGQDIYQVPPSLGPLPGQIPAPVGGTGTGQDVYQVPPSLDKRSWDSGTKPLSKVKVPTRVGQIYVYDTLKGDQDIYDVPPTRQQFSTQVYDTPPMVVKGPSSGQDIYDTPSGSDKNPQQTVYDFPPSVSKDVPDGPPLREDTYDVPPHFAKLKPPPPGPPGPYLHNNMAADGDEDDEPPIPEDVYDVPPPLLADKRLRETAGGGDIYDIPAALRPPPHLHQQAQDVYDFPREREEREEQSVYDVPPQVVRDAQSGVEDVSVSFKRLSACSTGSTHSSSSCSLDLVPVRDPSAPQPLAPPLALDLDLDQAMELLSRLTQAVESGVAQMMSLVSGNWRGAGRLEAVLPAMRAASERARGAVRDFLDFARDAAANAGRAPDRSLQAKLSRQVSKMEDGFRGLVRHGQALDAAAWSHVAMATPAAGGDDLDRLIMAARGIPDDAKQLASFLHGNASLLFRRTNRTGGGEGTGGGSGGGGEKVHIQSRPLPSPPKFTAAEEEEERGGGERPYDSTEEGWMEDYDYVHLQGKEEFEKNQRQLLEKGNIIRHNKTQLEQQQIKQFERLEQEVSRPINSDMTGWAPPPNHPLAPPPASSSSSSSRLCPGDRHLLLFYQEQCEQNVTTVTNAIDAFFSAVGSNQPPKIFVAHGKFVILSAHKLVFIGDTLARQARSPEVKGRAAQSSNALCEKLKDVVVSTKMAALQYPAPGAAREMTERVRELAACTQQFRMALGQLLLM